jgi:serine/arginine repetitive matrix protein 1
MDSEERPFEHWYRGEVSRNGGVGELRVGKRQEMLDIANYGHMTRNYNQNANLNASPRWGQPPSPYSAPREDKAPQHHRKRAGSIGGITEVERVRGIYYLTPEEDEEDMAYAIPSSQPVPRTGNWDEVRSHKLFIFFAQ